MRTTPPSGNPLPGHFGQLTSRSGGDGNALTAAPVHGNRDTAKGDLRVILSDVGMTIDQLAP